MNLQGTLSSFQQDSSSPGKSVGTRSCLYYTDFACVHHQHKPRLNLVTTCPKEIIGTGVAAKFGGKTGKELTVMLFWEHMLVDQKDLLQERGTFKSWLNCLAEALIEPESEKLS